MRDVDVLGGRSARRRRRDVRPNVDRLEDRKLLYATLGGHFAYGSRITYSFAPDGTSIGGPGSNLFSAMAAKGFTTAQWQGAIQKAAAAWAQVANINLVLVPDNGAAFGSAGDQQGDSDFGDIRIGGSTLSGGTLATAFLPPPFNGGTLAGDIVFNTSMAWQINNDYDLQTVAMHEIGHALGLDHSADTTADMYGAYNGMKQTLRADDIAGIQAVWGARPADQYEGLLGNGTNLTATNINSKLNAYSQAVVAGADITSASDLDYYVVNAPAGTDGTLVVTMQSSNLSSLSPKLLIYNGLFLGIGSATAPNVFGGTISVTITGVTPGQTYYIRAQAANGGATGIGAYGLNVDFGAGSMPAIAPPYTTVASTSDRGGGSSNDSLPAGHWSPTAKVEIPVIAGLPADVQDSLAATPSVARKNGFGALGNLQRKPLVAVPYGK